MAILLNMKTLAKEIMATEVLTVTPQSTTEEAVQLFVKHNITGVPVVDATGKMIGVCSEYDVIKSVAKKSNKGIRKLNRPIRYTRKVVSILEDTTLPEVVRLFIENKVRRLPVLDKRGKLVGIISRRDLMKVFYYRAKLQGVN